MVCAFCVGAFGAGLLGIIPFKGGLFNGFAGAPLGMGGGARGFSKLPSWFCGNLGLAGGEIIAPPGENGVELIPAAGVIGPW